MIYQEVIFTKEECDNIINYKEKYDSFLITPEWSLLNNSRTVYHKEKNFNGMEVEFGKDWVKKYNVWDIPINEETIWFYDKIYTWFMSVSKVKLNKKVCFNNSNIAHKLHEYIVGDKFDLHKDKTENTMDWIWNLGIQLNTNYVGGDYICYNINNEVVNISKEIGNVVAYQSDVLHEIKEIASGVRYSMVIKIHSWELIHKNEKSLF
jgi:hypothetical protein